MLPKMQDDNDKNNNSRISKHEERVQFLVGLDFDLTLSCHRVYGRKDFHRLADYVFGGQERIELLQEFLNVLITRHQGVCIVIISWNFKDIIQEALDQVGLLSYISCIYDRHAMIENGGYHDGKVQIMQQLMQSCGILSRNHAVFVDDCPDVLQHFMTTSSCCQTVLVQDAKGISVDEMKQIARKLFGLEFDPAAL